MVALHDCRSDSETYRTTQELLLGDHQAACVYLLPPASSTAIGAWLARPTSSTSPLACTISTEEIRLPHDDPAIAYDWSPHTR